YMSASMFSCLMHQPPCSLVLCISLHTLLLYASASILSHLMHQPPHSLVLHVSLHALVLYVGLHALLVYVLTSSLSWFTHCLFPGTVSLSTWSCCSFINVVLFQYLPL